jgi:hypothetical protein
MSWYRGEIRSENEGCLVVLSYPTGFLVYSIETFCYGNVCFLPVQFLREQCNWYNLSNYITNHAYIYWVCTIPYCCSSFCWLPRRWNGKALTSCPIVITRLNEEYFIADTWRNTVDLPYNIQGNTQNLMGIIHWLSSDQVLLLQGLFIWQPILQEICEEQLFCYSLCCRCKLYESYQ